MGMTRNLSGKAATDLARICGYLEKNFDRIITRIAISSVTISHLA
jgi:hypothetical protein